jgi:hypothetical protein
METQKYKKEKTDREKKEPEEGRNKAERNK